MNIMIGINSLSSCSYPAYTNHIQGFFRIGKWAERNGHNILLNNPDRMSIDRMRNQCAKIAIEAGFDYLLFWDDDVIVPPDFIQSMIDCDADIVAADVLIRGYPFNHMAFVGDKKGLIPISDLNTVMADQGGKEVIDVGAVGFSLCLIKVELLKKVAAPWFVTGLSNTEDIYFCLKAKEFDPNVTIKLDTKIKCAHILWPEMISSINKEAFTEYMETTNPHLRVEKAKNKKIQSPDRGDEYLKSVEAVLEESEETIG